jgi:hypothetical protein
MLVESDSLATRGRKRVETGAKRRITVTGSGGQRAEKRVLGFQGLVAMPQMGVCYFLEKTEQTP